MSPTLKKSANTDPEPRFSGGVTAITVRGFKSLIDRRRVEIRPLTILAGANSCGKSSVMQPVLLLKQTIDATSDPGPLRLEGPNVFYTSSEQFLSKSSRKSSRSFSVGIEVSGDSELTLKFAKRSQAGIDLEEMLWKHGSVSPVRIRRGMSSTDIKRLFLGEPKSLFVDMLERLESQGQGRVEVWRERCFFNARAYWESAPGREIREPFDDIVAPVESNVRRTIHVPGLRGNLERTYQTTGIGAEFPGTFWPYVGSIVSDWKSRNDSRLDDLSRALGELGLTWKIDARPVDETRVELRVGRLQQPKRGGARDFVNIADVGFGVSQVLPVLVALLAAEPGQLVYIEQPEIHLHPRAQVALAGILADAARRGVRVVAETHSQILLLAIQTLVAEGKLPADLVALHWFQRNKDGATTVHHAELDQAGTFGDWPEDFADVALDAQSRYLDAVDAAHAKL